MRYHLKGDKKTMEKLYTIVVYGDKSSSSIAIKNVQFEGVATTPAPTIEEQKILLCYVQEYLTRLKK